MEKNTIIKKRKERKKIATIIYRIYTIKLHILIIDL